MTTSRLEKGKKVKHSVHRGVCCVDVITQLSAKCENEHFYGYESFKDDSVQTTKADLLLKICPFYFHYLYLCTWFWERRVETSDLKKAVSAQQ